MQKQQIVDAVADYIVKDGTMKTYSGNWITTFDEIPEALAVPDFVSKHSGDIFYALTGREEISDIELEKDGFNIVYGLAFCPNYEGEDEDEFEQ